MILVDTNIVSFYFRRDTRTEFYRSALAGQIQAIAFVTLAEIYKWPVERNFPPHRAAALEGHVKSYPERFAQEALGHNSKAVHRAYAKRALMKLPSLQEYEERAALTAATTV